MKYGDIKNTENVEAQSIKKANPKQLTGVPKGEERENQKEEILEEITNKNFLELIKNIYVVNPQEYNNNINNNDNK